MDYKESLLNMYLAGGYVKRVADRYVVIAEGGTSFVRDIAEAIIEKFNNGYVIEERILLVRERTGEGYAPFRSVWCAIFTFFDESKMQELDALLQKQQGRDRFDILDWRSELLVKDSEKMSRLTTADMFNAAWRIVSALPDVKAAVEALDYANPTRESAWLAEIAEEANLVVYVNEGGSEGVYIDAKLVMRDGIQYHIGTLKTLDEGVEAHLRMGQLAGALTWAFERYLSNFY